MNSEFEPDGAESIERLWTDVERQRFFLIPDGVSMPPGELEIRSANGRVWAVDEATAVRWEVSRERGIAWAKDTLRSVVGQLAAGIGEALAGPRRGSASRDDGADGPEGRVAPDRRSTTPGVDLLADLSGHTRQELAGDYSAMGRALREHLGDLGRAALDSVSGDPERMAAAQARMAAWNETLKSRGVGAAGGEKSGAAVTAYKASDSDAEEHRSGASDDHPGDGTGAPESEAGRSDIAAQLRAMADAMRRRADALAAAREAAVRDAARSPDSHDSNAPDTSGKNPTGKHPDRA